VGAIMGLHEHLLRDFRIADTRSLGRRVAPQVAQALRSAEIDPIIHQVVRMAGIALWEREHERIADSIGI
jgi:hypothetical protein